MDYRMLNVEELKDIFELITWKKRVAVEAHSAAAKLPEVIPESVRKELADEIIFRNRLQGKLILQAHELGYDLEGGKWIENV